MKMKKTKPKFLNSILTAEIFFSILVERGVSVMKKILKNFYRDFFQSKKIDAILMYNDCRIIHAKAIKVAKELGIEIWIFEEGYLRPYCITLEKDGVNANSSLPRDKNFYLSQNIFTKESIKEIQVDLNLWLLMLFCIGCLLLFWLHFLTTNFIIVLYILLNFYFGLDLYIENIFIRLQKKN